VNVKILKTSFIFLMQTIFFSFDFGVNYDLDMFYRHTPKKKVYWICW